MNGREALDAFEEASDAEDAYKLVCLDIMMPVMNGQETLKEIRSREKVAGIKGLNGVKVVMTTALRDSQHCVQAFREGCEAYLTKPIEEESLAKALGGMGITQPEASAC